MNPYEILELNSSADLKLIRRQYRKMARRWHPDRNPENVLEAERRFKQIAEAYRILSDPKARHLWDLRHSFAGRQTRTLWDRLREETDNHKSQALIVLYDLTHGRVQEAFKLWEELSNQEGFSLDTALEGRDYRDCCFLLAEQLVLRNRLREAIAHYHKVYWQEHRHPIMEYYKQETRERLFDLLTQKYPQQVEPRLALKAYARSLCYAHTPTLRRRLLILLSNQAYQLGNHPLALKAARALSRNGNKVSRLLVCKEYEDLETYSK